MAQASSCALTDFSCTTLTDDQLHHTLILIILGLLVWRYLVTRKKTYVPTRRSI